MPIGKQRRFAKNNGRDTHVRSVERDLFKVQSTKTFEIKTGEVFLNQVEPAFKQNAVSIKLSKGGRIDGVPLPGAFIDPFTGNLHGSYEGVIPGQMISIGFVDGNSAAPIILNRYPYQGKGNTLVEDQFLTPMYKAGYMATDVLLGHFSGSKIGLYTGGGLNGALPGSIGIDAFTECNVTAKTNILLDALVSAEVKSAMIKLTGSTSIESSAPSIKSNGSTTNEISAPLVKIDGSATVEINGNTKQFVTWLELNTALQLLISAITVPLVVTGAVPASPPNPVTASWTIPPTIDITLAKTTKTLCGA
jgi:hypothetical protein